VSCFVDVWYNGLTENDGKKFPLYQLILNILRLVNIKFFRLKYPYGLVLRVVLTKKI
jgi:hypothetical protein